MTETSGTKPLRVIQNDRAAILKACDTLAANPTDRYRQAQGVEFEKLDLGAGTAACEAAVAAFPDDAVCSA